jgi:hypothetical protein
MLMVGCAGGGKGEAPDTGDTGDAADTGGGSVIAGRPCPADSPLTWGNFGEATLLTHCVGCHSENLEEGASRAHAPIGVDFNTHALTRSWLARIHARSADDNRTMPPVDTMSDATRAQLGDWLACGAP